MRKKVYAVLVGLSLPFLAIAGLESVTYISDLVATNPLSSDPAYQGDDHLRAIKTAIKNTFPNINAAVTLTDENLNNAALKAAANVFTAIQEIESTGPLFRLDESDADTNERMWLIRNSTGIFAISTATTADPDTAAVNALTIDRTGTAIGTTNFGSATVTIQGNRIPKTAFGRFQSTDGALAAVGSDSGVTSGSRNGTGSYSVNVTAAGFAEIPVCSGNLTGASGSLTVLAFSATSITVQTFTSAGSAADRDYTLTCMGV